MKKLIIGPVVALIFCSGCASSNSVSPKTATLNDVTNVLKNAFSAATSADLIASTNNDKVVTPKALVGAAFSTVNVFSIPGISTNGVVTFVAPHGSNGNQGTNPWSPYATLLYASTNLHEGNTIALAGNLTFTNVLPNGFGPVCTLSNVTVIGNNNTVMLTNGLTGGGNSPAGVQVVNDATIRNVALCGYYPTNLYFTLRVSGGSLVKLVNDTIGGTSDGLYQNSLTKPVTTVAVNCTFTSCWDTVNFSPSGAGTNAVNKFLNCNFKAVADGAPDLNPAVKFYKRANGYFQVGGGTTWAKNCSFTGANGTSQTYGFYIQGPGAVAYLSDCTVSATSTHGGDVKQFYIDGATVYTDFWVDPARITLTNGAVLITNMVTFGDEAFMP
jgi:hypothetical protein